MTRDLGFDERQALRQARSDVLRNARPPASTRKRATTVGLTDREREVLRMVADGMSNADIAADLHVASDTVKTHMRHVMEKFGVRNRTHAVASGLRAGVIR